jgi:hypothetical protein
VPTPTRQGYTPGRILVIEPRPQPQFYELDGMAFGFLFVDLEPQWESVIDPATILLNPFAAGLLSAELGMGGMARGALGAMGHPRVETFDELWTRLKARDADDQERDELRLLGLDDD